MVGGAAQLYRYVAETRTQPSFLIPGNLLIIQNGEDMKFPTELIAALVGGLFTLLVAVIASLIQGRQSTRILRLQLEHQDRKEATSQRRKYIEELFIAVKHWFDMIFIDNMNYRRVMDGKLTYNQALDLTIKNMGDQDYDFKRIEMIISLYFPT